MEKSQKSQKGQNTLTSSDEEFGTGSPDDRATRRWQFHYGRQRTSRPGFQCLGTPSLRRWQLNIVVSAIGPVAVVAVD
ncbi:hypothetical protein ACU639_24420 [Streptomyces cynarae]|uniref:hypothetical protein n=1 Tax=Streptomyces cynarae TaxID=2981134 RepID=UPI00406BE3C8